MSSASRASLRTGRAFATLAAAGVLAGALLVEAVAPAAAASPARVWTARLGSGGANGLATLALGASGGGSVSVALKGLPSGMLVSGSVRRGTCAKQGTVVAALPGGRTSTSGKLAKRRTLVAREVAAVGVSGPLVATIRAGSVRRCAALVERVVPPPSPTPTPAPTATPVPTSAPSPTPAPTGSASPVQVGQRFMVNGQYYLIVVSVDGYTDPLGQTAVIVGVEFSSFSSGIEVRSSDFVLVEPDGSLRAPIYCVDCIGDSPWPPKPWSITLERGGVYTRLLAFPAPVLGRLDLKYGSLVIRIRN